MSTPVPVTAVFDIGKTNKKFLLFDESFKVIHRGQTAIPLSTDDDGDPCDDLGDMVDWMYDTFEHNLADNSFAIKAINFTTYGASFVHLDDRGKVVTPLYDYLKAYPDDLLDEFYDKYGGKTTFALDTASPSLGMLNSGLQLYWLKHKKPKVFKKISHSLHFPQYASYLFTNFLCSELTSIGCHTAMWNFRDNSYHKWIKNEGIRPLLPPVVSAMKYNKIKYKGNEMLAGVGVHDSSASLAPYLMAVNEPFLLISTGTWSITLNPFNNSQLSIEELDRDCLNFMNVYGKQVRASRFLLGKEYEHQKEKLRKKFGVSSYEQEVRLNERLMNELIGKEEVNGLRLETASGSGPYPQKSDKEWELFSFNSYEEAYHQLMMDLVSIQVDSIKLSMNGDDISRIIVTGGFSNNNMFMKLLATKFPNSHVYTADLSDSTALGAALLMKDENEINPDDFMNLKEVTPLNNILIRDYHWYNV